MYICTLDMKKTRNAIAVRFNKRAKEMLLDFVNTRPERASYRRFKRRWEDADGFKWPGKEDGFRATQQIARAIWSGQKRGIEGLQMALNLGLKQIGDSEPGISAPVYIDWQAGALFLAPGDLKELVWLTMLQYSQRLGVCANKAHSCPTPYFIRRKPDHKYCSDACAAPSQREFKLRWWHRERGAGQAST